MNALGSIAADTDLPGLAAAIDPDRACAAFARALKDAGVHVSELSCCVERVRVKRAVKAVVGYRLEGRHADGSSFTQLAMARVYPHALVDQRYGQATSRPVSRPIVGPAVAHLHEVDAVAWFFPNDRKLNMVTDPFGLEAAQDMLNRALGADTELVAKRVEIVRYVPEQGCTASVTMDLARSGMAEDAIHVYAKCRSDDRGRVSHAVGQAIGDHYGEGALAPRALHYDARRRTGWQSRVPGRPLTLGDVLADPAAWARRIGDCLARLQMVRVHGLRQTSATDVAERAVLNANRTIPALPMHGPALTAISRRLRDTAPRNREMVVVHGDLHPANMLVDGYDLRFIDLDVAGFGDPEFDRASLTAALVKQACDDELGDEVIADLIQAFRETADGRFDWFLAASLVAERIYRCATRLNGQSDQTVPRLLSLAADCLQRSECR
jgi:hypothetical protein